MSDSSFFFFFLAFLSAFWEFKKREVLIVLMLQLSCFRTLVVRRELVKWAKESGSDVKSLPAMWETWVWSLGLEDPLEKWVSSHSSTLAWGIPLLPGEFHGQRSLMVYTPCGQEESDTTERLTSSIPVAVRDRTELFYCLMMLSEFPWNLCL